MNQTQMMESVVGRRRAEVKFEALEYASMLHEALLIPLGETMIWREKERIRPVRMDVSLSIRRVNAVPNGWIRELWVMTRGGGAERIEESDFRWFGCIERMGNDTISRRVYVGVCG